MPTYEEALARLRENADEGYRAFHKKLLKNDGIAVIGVRMPVLRKMAKEWKGCFSEILTFPDDYYEITFLKCAVAATLPFGEFCCVSDELVFRLDNWATCDCFDPACIAGHKEEYLPYIRRYLTDEREFVKRFALVTLLHDYVTEEYLPLIFESVCSCREDQYYVMMAAAWLVAEVVVRFYGAGTDFLKQGRLPKQTQNRAIRKACESFRLAPQQKAELRTFKK